jgi:protein-tyrosine-phosphatase
VLGSDTASFLAVTRSLGRRGIDVHIGWCPREAPAAHSRYVRRVHRLPSPSDDRWTEALAELMTVEGFDLVVPTNAPTLIPLQRARSELEPFGRLCLLDDRAFEVTFDKIKTRQLAVAQGVNVASGWVVRGQAEIDAALKAATYPLVIRPQTAFSFDDLDRRNSARRVDDEGSAREAIHERLRRGLVLVEQSVTGVGWGLGVLAARGEIVLSQQHERLHELPHDGGSCYCRTVPRDQAFMQSVIRLVRELDYTGVAMFEFRGDPAGRWVLTEITGGFWDSLPLALAAGADFPYALWQLLVDGLGDFDDYYRIGVHGRDLKRDLKWAWLNARADRDGRAAEPVPLKQVAVDVARVVRRDEHADQFVLDDPRPGLVALRHLGLTLIDLLRSRFIGGTLLQRRHRRRARRAIADAQTILFVCYGNICRSPFAAGLVRRIAPSSLEVHSAGTLDLEAKHCPSIAREISREFGVELDGHRSQPVTAELVERADAIFAFDQRNRRVLQRRHPEARRKLHLIGALGDGPLIVDDPINGSEHDFRRAYSAISDALRQGLLGSKKGRP